MFTTTCRIRKAQKIYAEDLRYTSLRRTCQTMQRLCRRLSGAAPNYLRAYEQRGRLADQVFRVVSLGRDSSRTPAKCFSLFRSGVDERGDAMARFLFNIEPAIEAGSRAAKCLAYPLMGLRRLHVVR